MDSLTGLSLPPVSSGNEPRPQMIARGEGRTHTFSTFTGVLLNGPVLFLKWWSRWGTAPHKDGLKIHRSLIFHPSWHRAKDNKYLTTPTDNLKKSTVTQKEKAEAHSCNPTDSAPSRCPTGNPPPPFLIFLVNVSFYFPLHITQIQMIIIKSAQLTLAKPTALWKKQNKTFLHYILMICFREISSYTAQEGNSTSLFSS